MSLTHHSPLLSLFPGAHHNKDDEQQHHHAEHDTQDHVEHLGGGLRGHVVGGVHRGGGRGNSHVGHEGVWLLVTVTWNYM